MRSPGTDTDLLQAGSGLDAFRTALRRFFGEGKRDLPWRRDRDPYRILVSEVMLQQTRAQTVVPYFERWIQQFPSISALADADEQEVLKLWQGLGYYSRATNLHNAAREVIQGFGGRIPEDPQTLESLPGIGPYTAGAVASIAFGVPAPAVDGNVRRVLSRLMDHPDPSARQLNTWASALIDPRDPGSFNQALMELGSQICRPRGPRCDTCPVERFCGARVKGTQQERPRRKPKRPVPSVVESLAAAVRSDGRRGRQISVLLRRRPPGGLLGGMWEIPGAPVCHGARAEDVASAVLDGIEELPERGLGPATRLTPVDHAFTHRRVHYLPFLFWVRIRRAARVGREDLRWMNAGDADRAPISVAQLKVLREVFELPPTRFPESGKRERQRPTEQER